MDAHRNLTLEQQVRLQQRRTFLGNACRGVGAAALASLINPAFLRAASSPDARTTGAKLDRWPGVLHPLHFAPKAKRVIFLCMAGGPSHLETFDYKPKLAEMHGKPMPESFTKGQPIAQLQNAKLNCFGPQWGFKKYGKNGTEISELLPKIGSVADDICVVRSVRTEAINHDPAHTFMNTGTTISGRPSMGSWITYGLGSDASDLPGFVVLTSPGPRRAEPADRLAAVERRVPPQPVPGRAVPRAGRPGALPVAARRASRPPSSGTWSTRSKN